MRWAQAIFLARREITGRLQEFGDCLGSTTSLRLVALEIAQTADSRSWLPRARREGLAVRDCRAIEGGAPAPVRKGGSQARRPARRNRGEGCRALAAWPAESPAAGRRCRWLRRRSVGACVRNALPKNVRPRGRGRGS